MLTQVPGFQDLQKNTEGEQKWKYGIFFYISSSVLSFLKVPVLSSFPPSFPSYHTIIVSL
jgi:hypothetical protein